MPRETFSDEEAERALDAAFGGVPASPDAPPATPPAPDSDIDAALDALAGEATPATGLEGKETDPSNMDAAIAGMQGFWAVLEPSLPAQANKTLLETQCRSAATVAEGARNINPEVAAPLVIQLWEAMQRQDWNAVGKTTQLLKFVRPKS